MKDDMGGFGYPEDATNWDLHFSAYGVSLPPSTTNHDPFPQFPPLQPQVQLQEMPAPDTVEWQLAPDLLLATDLAAVGGGGRLDEGIFVWPDQPQPVDLPDSAERDLDLPPQPSSAAILQTLAPVLQPPADETPLADKTDDSNSGGGDGSSSRPKRQYSKKKDRTVTQVLDLDSTPPQDEWAWRKYGQKTIKGSQYLRSYYKCSSDKKCKARRYVDRSTIDSRYFIVSYDGEHGHAMPPFRKITAVPQAPAPQPILAVGETQQAPAATPAIASASLSSPTTPLRSPFAELDLDVEDYRDTMDVTMLLRDEDMTTKDATASMLFVEQDGLQELKDGAPGKGSGDNNNLPMPYEHAAGSNSSGGGGDGSTRTGPFQAPAENFFNETFCFEPWDSLLDWP
ncbi:unnamed protein product [Urochloa decumbens]|uniref:WRKY domain-containing protein n=1 Tax=Urochloa decumbens TaxID=240449 RepID=A0ABC9DGS0_9POAL